MPAPGGVCHVAHVPEYMVLDAMTLATRYAMAHREGRRRLAGLWWIFGVTPAHKFMLFWFRFGGFLTGMKGPPSWHTPISWAQAAQHG